MKKFLLKVILLFGLVAVVDVLSGFAYGYLRGHAKGGSTEKSEYIASKANEEIIIMGSSRATHHYNPSVISDSVGMSCYNCGEKGNGIVLAYGRYKMLTSRYKPRLIVFEITPGFDYYEWDPYSKYLGHLRPYYNRAGIKEIFQDFDDELSCIRMQSSLYQNNTRLVQDVIDNIVYRDNHNGFAPLAGQLKSSKVEMKEREYVIDSLKLDYVDRFLREVKKDGVPIVMTISPVYCDAEGAEMYSEAVRLCKKYDIQLIDYRHYDPISTNPEYFVDGVHLNEKGANLYSSLIAKDIKKVIDSNNK